MKKQTKLSLDLREHGGPRGGEPQLSERRLFVRFTAYAGTVPSDTLSRQVDQAELELVLYEDIWDAEGVGIVALTESPDDFLRPYRQWLAASQLAQAAPVPELTMLGRTYGSGREENLEDWLLDHVRRRVTEPAMEWAVWYPLRRKPEFYRLPPEELRPMMAEHGMLGRRYGEAGQAADVRLKCFGLDRHDNEFVIGLLGSELYPLSKLVEDMRETRQTAEYMDSLGPFFAGRRVAISQDLRERIKR